MTPHADLVPALPVLRDSSSPPVPRSSVPAWITTARLKQLARGTSGKGYNSPDNVVGAIQSNQMVPLREIRVSGLIRQDVAQVTNMTNVICWCSVCLIQRVEMGSCRCASVGQISRLAARVVRRVHGGRCSSLLDVVATKGGRV